jgi:hypothetical protein
MVEPSRAAWRTRDILDDGPVGLPDDWLTIVDECLPQIIVDEIRKSLKKH